MLIGVYLVRRAQMAQARGHPVSAGLVDRRNIRLAKALVGFLIIGTAALLYLASSGLAATPAGSKGMFILLGAMLASFGGLVGYLSSRGRSNSP